ncbi:MAG TPA: DUF2934 domain-containing protein [Polyangia bacterium]|jgi:hypothetical protein|nr:DUF2934 domain-containing protein [Polyangia bacterium]
MPKAASKTGNTGTTSAPRATPTTGNAAAALPSTEDIAKRAYELYLQRGSESGYELEDWLQAEAELVAAAASTSR